MATAIQSPSAIPSHEPRLSPFPKPTAQVSILEEVRLSQVYIRDRLAVAIFMPPASTSASALPSVPLIALGDSFSSSLEDRKQVASQIRQACLNTGFFQIANHGVTTSAMEGVLTQSKRYFKDLTPAQEDSMHVKHSALFRGYKPGDFTYNNPDDNSPSTEYKRVLGYVGSGRENSAPTTNRLANDDTKRLTSLQPYLQNRISLFSFISIPSCFCFPPSQQVDCSVFTGLQVISYGGCRIFETRPPSPRGRTHATHGLQEYGQFLRDIS